MCMTSRRSFNLTEQQKRELEAAFRQSRDGADRTRLQAERLYGSGYPVEEISDCGRPGNAQQIVTVRGIGCCFED